LKRAVLGAAAGISLGAALAVETTLRVPVFDFRSASSSPWLLSSLPPFLLGFAAAVVLGALGWLAGRRGRADLLTPFLPCGLAASVFMPGVFAFAPFLASFAGRFLEFILVVALAVSLSRLARGPRIAVSAGWIFVAGLVFYFAVGYWIATRVGLSGDEPHYLLIAESLLRDHDLEVQNNYGAGSSLDSPRAPRTPCMASVFRFSSLPGSPLSGSSESSRRKQSSRLCS
jgi:hypothetical protein